MKTYTPITLGRRALKKEQLPHNWESLDPRNIELSPNNNYFVFGGNTTTSDAASNGNAKNTETLIPSTEREKSNIFSFVYESEPFSSPNIYLNKNYAEDIRAIYHSTFEPLLYDKYNNPKSKQGIEQVFEKLIFVAHCGGSSFVNIIIEEFYNSLSKIFKEGDVNNLIGKIQYLAYAPLELPERNVTALVITPFKDPNCSWGKALEFADAVGINTDYPKKIVGKLHKARNNARLDLEFNSTFEETRAIAFKIGNITYLIPGQMNPNHLVGDHSFECIGKQHLLHSGTDYEQTAQLTQAIAKLYMKSFTSRTPSDVKGLFSKTVKMIEGTPPSSQKAF